MNIGIRKLMRRKESVKEGYDGRSLTGRGSSFFWGREAVWRGRRVLVSFLGFSGSVGEFCNLRVSLQGAPSC